MLRSLLSWERGLKSSPFGSQNMVDTVAPLVGAWIEIVDAEDITGTTITVAPLVGAWIEMSLIKSHFAK